MALMAPVLCYFLQQNAAHWFNGYVIGIEILAVNGLLTFVGLFAVSKKLKTE
jgi:hypothetical protein